MGTQLILHIPEGPHRPGRTAGPSASHMGGRWGQIQRGFSLPSCNIRACSADGPAWIRSSVSEQMASVSQTLHHPVEMPAWGSTSRAGFSHSVIPGLSHPSYEMAFCTGLRPQLGLEKLLQRCWFQPTRLRTHFLLYWEHSALGQERNLSPGWVISAEVVINSLLFSRLRGSERCLWSGVNG